MVARSAAPALCRDHRRGLLKPVSFDEARVLVAQWRSAGHCVVLANGAFDLLHVGHVRYLEGARALGDRLLVAVNSDASVSAAKGPTRPVISQAERAELVLALRCVDAVIVFDEPDVRHLIRSLQPEVHAKGTDYTVDTVPEREEVERYGGTVAIAGDPKNHSTSAVLSKLNR